MSKAGLPVDQLDTIAQKCAQGSSEVGNYAKLTFDTVLRILELAK
jgi:hypothetical protein